MPRKSKQKLEWMNNVNKFFWVILSNLIMQCKQKMFQRFTTLTIFRGYGCSKLAEGDVPEVSLQLLLLPLARELGPLHGLRHREVLLRAQLVGRPNRLWVRCLMWSKIVWIKINTSLWKFRGNGQLKCCWNLSFNINWKGCMHKWRHMLRGRDNYFVTKVPKSDTKGRCQKYLKNAWRHLWRNQGHYWSQMCSMCFRSSLSAYEKIAPPHSFIHIDQATIL